jgi:hypothetical protein
MEVFYNEIVINTIGFLVWVTSYSQARIHVL